MPASPTNLIALLMFTVLLAIGQAMFKAVALRVAGLAAPQSLWALVALPAFYGALLLYGTTTLLWIWILGRVPLSQAYPWASLGVVLVPAIGLLWFGEQVRPSFWIGAALIVAGIILTQYGSTPAATPTAGS